MSAKSPPAGSLARRTSQMYAAPATVKTANQNDGPLGRAQRQFEERVRFSGGDHLVVDLGDFGNARDQAAGADDVASARLRHVPNRHVDRAALRLSLAVGSDVDMRSPTHRGDELFSGFHMAMAIAALKNCNCTGSKLRMLFWQCRERWGLGSVKKWAAWRCPGPKSARSNRLRWRSTP